ncbi:hypothetical protein [Aquipuribacter sp. MA13-6]|uniref:hypothetical protein n=1 Tax=unclassified Aquipuribacter TaxID=2635084 RepID=UPI003EEFD109
MSTALNPDPAVDLAPLEIKGPGPGTLVAVELRKSVDTLTGRWILGVTVALVVGALALALGFVAEAQWSLSTFAAYAALPLSLLLPVLGVLLVSGEFSQRTTLTTFALVPSRHRFVLAKTAAALVLAVLGALVALLLSLVATGVATAIEPGTSWAVDWPVLAQLLVAQLVFVLVGVGFGLLAQNTPLGVVAYLLLPSLLSPVILLVPSLADIGVWIDLGTASFPLLAPEAMDAGEWARVGTTTALWAGVPFVLGWLRLLRREIA